MRLVATHIQGKMKKKKKSRCKKTLTTTHRTVASSYSLHTYSCSCGGYGRLFRANTTTELEPNISFKFGSFTNLAPATTTVGRCQYQVSDSGFVHRFVSSRGKTGAAATIRRCECHAFNEHLLTVVAGARFVHKTHTHTSTKPFFLLVPSPDIRIFLRYLSYSTAVGGGGLAGKKSKKADISFLRGATHYVPVPYICIHINYM